LQDPGDIVLMPDPYYPVYLAGAQLADSRVFFMPHAEKNDFCLIYRLYHERLPGKQK
jgi:aspartate/methionine/tyrosine aminotransferase